MASMNMDVNVKLKSRSGWYSTKLHLALIGIAVVTAVFLFVVEKTGSAAGFGEFCITVVSIAASYSGSRVAESFAQRSARPEVSTGPG